MKGLKIISVLSFILIFYPAIAIPIKYKEWFVAVFSFLIFVISLALLYILKSEETDPSFEDYNAERKKKVNKSESNEKSAD